ncbi:HD-GYP domain-containing protein [Filibacter tadaridae]|uniref:Cyclic di-GMP phosphodiesterase response regulator RpfG n=1 Tax=Filibacter tadaridae TaxID=2483811 RepID=A0A3P5WSX2_9BACL|nr:HD-GYP domain-containing protein [Filibacter tadaridae]VDC21716.1 Cyclic di-GMP phosphodiesterase response regulator RpfG [Filibacter tadaridae]
MKETYIKVSDLRPGIIISHDVFVNTNYPIVRKDTELSAEHLEVLYAFGVKKVKVEEQVVVKRDELQSSVGEGSVKPTAILSEIPAFKADIKSQYDNTIQNYKKELTSWRAGIRPDIAKVRSMTMPLVESFIEQKKLLPLLNEFSNSIDYMYHHSIAVGVLAAAISKQMGFPKGQTLQLGLAGVLADCGMVKINTAITEKAAFLTKNEFDEVKKHTIYSLQMVKDSPFLRQEMKLAILQHHERLDGSGYPQGVKLDKVSVLSQIVAVADVYHARTSERVHRSKESPFKVIEMIKEEEFGKFDIKVIHALEQLLGHIAIGMKVRLTNGEEGDVMFVHRDAGLRPMVKKDVDGTVLDLTTNRHLAIEKILK